LEGTPVALFTDDPPPRYRSPRARRAGRVGWVAIGVALATGIVLGVTPAPYVIEKPGPVYNTIGTTTSDDGVERPLITIDGATSYPTAGSLDLLTVSLVGNPDNRPSWLKVAAAWLDPSQAVLPIEAVFPTDVTTEQRDEQNTAQMVNSQQDAIAAALTSLGYAYPTVVSVVSLPDGSPAAGTLLAEDQITALNGAPIDSVAELRTALTGNGSGVPATVGIVRSGAAQTVTVTPIESSGAVVIGINVRTDYQFPFTVTIQLDRVGGPSAGMMFALGIIDKLTPGELQGGADVAGTGTIDQAGTVGPIGGIRQKLAGARSNGARWFLAPADDCDEVTGHIPDGLTVFSVTTLDDALAALEGIRTGVDTSALPHCPVS
jgi:Lon-like protease